VPFEHGDVLVRRGVKDDVRRFVPQDPRDSIPVHEVGEKWFYAYFAQLFRDFPMHVEEAIFRFVQQQKLSRVRRRNLAAKFRADAASRAAHEHGFSADDLGCLLRVYRNFLSLQKMLDPRAAQVSAGHRSAIWPAD
jgi:hypothetical protein